MLVVLVIGYFSVWYYQKAQKEKKNKAIVDYCEQFKWNDGLRNQDDWDADSIRLIGQTDFLCSEHLYLKINVKKSYAGICHDENSLYYYRTKNYKVFNSMNDCINSGGRKPYNN